MKEADSSYNDGFGLEGLEPGTYLFIRYEALTTASGYVGLRISFSGGEVDVANRRRNKSEDF